MRKYVTIPDIRTYPSYKNANCRLLYLHCSMGMDLSTRDYAHSWRQLSAELDIPLQQLRTALSKLEKDGLIATQQVTQRVTYGLTQQVTHKVTKIHILSVSELDEATNEATNSPTNSQTNSQINSQINSDNNNKNNLNSLNPSLTDARVAWDEKTKALAGVLHIEVAAAASLVEQFRQRQQLKQKTWASEGDLLAHLISWSEKRISSGTLRTVRSRSTDSEARKEEISRSKKELVEMTEKEKAWEEVCKVYRWWKDFEKKKDKKGAAEMRKAYEELRQQYCEKYGGDGAQ